MYKIKVKSSITYYQFLFFDILYNKTVCWAEIAFTVCSLVILSPLSTLLSTVLDCLPVQLFDAQAPI